MLARICAAQGWNVHIADTLREASIAANRLHAPVILCDRDSPGTEWRASVQDLAALPHAARVILISKVLDDYLWNEVAQMGGHDVLSKPLQEDDVVRAIKLAWSYWNSTTTARL
jgi:DNA-binding NtrC family response regulator